MVPFPRSARSILAVVLAVALVLVLVLVVIEVVVVEVVVVEVLVVEVLVVEVVEVVVVLVLVLVVVEVLVLVHVVLVTTGPGRGKHVGKALRRHTPRGLQFRLGQGTNQCCATEHQSILDWGKQKMRGASCTSLRSFGVQASELRSGPPPVRGGFGRPGGE